MTVVLGFMSLSANAFTFNHIQSQLVDYGYSTGSFGGFLSHFEGRYTAGVEVMNDAKSIEWLTANTDKHPLTEKQIQEEYKTEKEIAETIERWENATKGISRTVGLNSLFQISESTLLQFNFQLNTGYNSDALDVNPSIRLGVTVATQLTQDDSFTFTVSPKLLVGGKVFENRTNLFDTLDRELGKVSNGTTMRLEYTHKF